MLLFNPRFCYFFACQFFGALNDSIFRLALVAALSVGILQVDNSGVFIQLAAALFMLPFFIFSPAAGVIADAVDRRRLLRLIKTAEVAIIALASFGILAKSLPLLLLALFLTGIQSAFFGPIKYALLPSLLRPDELLIGNAWFSVSTFAAILIGTVAGAIFGGAEYLLPALCITLFAISLLGLLAAWLTPPVDAPVTAAPAFGIGRAYGEVMCLTHRNRPIYRRVLAASCFWLAGVVLLNELPHLGYETYKQMLAMVLAGVCLGGVACRLLFKTAITARYSSATIFASGALLLVIAALYSPAQTTAAFAVAVVAFCAVMTVFVVPLRAGLQSLAAPDERARVISCYNVYNAGFIVGATLLSAVVHLLLPDGATVVILAGCGVFLLALTVPVHYKLAREDS